MGARATSRLTWLVAACVFLSGTASLALEVVWSRSLKLVFGSTTLAITTILVAYMLGLGIGGLVGGRVAARLKNGIRAYGWMEVVVGVYAMCVPFVLALYPSLNRELLAPLGFWPAAIARFLLVLVVLLVPTILMGATLPVLVAALVRRRDEIGDRVGLLYGVNTLGAVAGVLGATFIAFGTLGVQGTNILAATLDVVVGLVAVFVLAPRLGFDAAADASHDDSASYDERRPVEGRDAGAARWVLVSYGVVGFTALACEVAWTRALSMILGVSVYAFATMLAGFLAGIALGSLLARRRLDKLRDPVLVYVFGLACLGLASLLVVFAFRALPSVFLGTFAAVGISSANLVWLGLVVSFVVMLAPTLVLGALFPLVVRIVGEARGHARAVGDVYFANTVGSATGAFCAGFLLIPGLGLRRTMGIAVGASLMTAAVLALRTRRSRALAAVCASVGVLVLAFPPSWRDDSFAVGVYYRSSAQLDFGLPAPVIPGVGPDEILFYDEGINCTVSVHRNARGLEEGVVSMRINGKTDASFADMSTQVLSGHLPILFGGEELRVPEDKGTALVIGYASGITAGSLSLYELAAIDVCEIEPAVIAASRWFEIYNHKPLDRDDVRLVVEDGRTVLATTRGLYDVIISEPSNPWMTGCSNLFTREFFAEADAALVPGGRLLQWIQLYGMDEDGFTSVLAALYESFDYAYGFLYDSTSTDLLLIATDEPLDPEALPSWDELSDDVRRDLARIRLFSTADLWSLLVLAPDDLRELAARAPVTNSDDSMFVELRAPWYLFDDTPATTTLIEEQSSGILPVLGDRFDWPRGLRGELAITYLSRRLNQRLGDAVIDRATTPEESLYRATYAGELGILVGKITEPNTLENLNRAVDLAPAEFLPRFHRGWLLNKLGRAEEAERDFAVALAARPDHLEARYERLKSLGTLGRMEEAAEEADRLVRSPLVETEPRLWSDAAVLSAGFGRLDEAIERMKRYLELEPVSPDPWRHLAQFYGAAGRDADREVALASADAAERTRVRDIHWLARWHERYGTRKEALEALEVALELAPDDAAVRADLERLRADG